MAFMEQQPQPLSGRKPPLDDTVPLIAVIEASQSLQSHTVNGTTGAARISVYVRAETRTLSIRPIRIHYTFDIDYKYAFKCL